MDMSSTARNYGGRSAPERVEQRRLMLIDAALEVAEAVGWRQLTVDRVCERARLSKRYFYESFNGIDALANAVVDYVVGGVFESIGIATRGDASDVPALAHATIAALVDNLTGDPRRARVLFGDLAMTEASTAHRAAAIRQIAAQVVTVARKIHRPGTVFDPIIQTTAALLIGGTGQAILSWLDGDIPGGRDDLVDNLTTLWLITGDGAAAHARDRAKRTR